MRESCLPKMMSVLEQTPSFLSVFDTPVAFICSRPWFRSLPLYGHVFVIPLMGFNVSCINNLITRNHHLIFKDTLVP